MNAPGNKFAKFFADRKSRDSFWIEAAKMDFTEELCKRMEELGINRKELAGKLGCSPAAVTKMLRGQQNFTLESMVKLARVLDTELRFHLQPESVQRHWFDLRESRQHMAPGYQVFVPSTSVLTPENPATAKENEDEDIALTA